MPEEPLDFVPTALDRSSTVYIAGHRGLVGSSLWRHFEDQGFTDLVGRTSSELDLKNRQAVFDFFAESTPDVVILAAAKVGGIMANSTYPVDFLSENLQIQVNVLDAALSSTRCRGCSSWGRPASTPSSPISRSARILC